MAFSPNNSMRFDRRLAIFAMVVAGVVVAMSGSSAEAGVILPWKDQSSAVVVDCVGDVCGSTSERELPPAEEPGPSEREDAPGREALIVGYLGTGGGASAPVNSSAGQTSLLLAAMFQLPAFVPLMTCLSRHLSERSLQLPRPPLGELLDPPKACV